MDKTKLIVPVVLIAIVAIVIAAGVVITDQNNKDNTECTATFNQNYDGASDINIKVEKGELIESPIVMREGTYLSGWYLDKNLTIPASFPYKMDSSKTFYAEWTTSIAAKYFNINYLKKTAEGIEKSNSYKTTTGFKEIYYEGFIGNHVSNGNDHIVYLASNGTAQEYVVFDLNKTKKLFSFPADDVVNIISYSKELFSEEFLQVAKTDGYYVYDLKGNCLGPSSKAAVTVLTDTVLFNDKFYRFDDDGNLKFKFNNDANVHIPDGGNCGSYYEMENMILSGTTVGYAVNILNDEFKVSNVFKFPAGASHCACASLYNGKFLVQYALEYKEGSSVRYAFIDDDIRYVLKSFIITENESENKEIKLARLIASSQDKQNSTGWDMYSVNAKSTIDVYRMTSGRALLDTTQTVIIDDEGMLYEWTYALFSTVYVEIDNTYEDGKYIGLSYDGNKIRYHIIDGTGKIFKHVLKDLDNPDCMKYFMVIGSTSIYDIDGNVVGDYGTKTYVGATNNVLFFNDGGNIKAFRDGGWVNICTGTDISIGKSCYVVKESGSYNVFTENGTKIVSTNYDYLREFTNSAGNHFIEVKTGQDVFKTFLLTY